jgi:hypothetical protein
MLKHGWSYDSCDSGLCQCSSRTVLSMLENPVQLTTSIDSVWQLSSMQHGCHAPTADTGLWPTWTVATKIGALQLSS